VRSHASHARRPNSCANPFNFIRPFVYKSGATSFSTRADSLCTHPCHPSIGSIAFALSGEEGGPFLEAPPARAKRRRPWHWLILIALTALAGASRFYKLDHPPVWGDEASTFRRVSGSFGDMLETLERDPFTPLFYEAEWAMRQYHHLTPFWLRFIPALAGALMVPAMYFLARQLASIRTSLVAALLTLCSAWMINYSRDAKMYMTFWLFVVLSAGCFCGGSDRTRGPHGSHGLPRVVRWWA